MRTVIKKSRISIFELARRMMCSFRVLMVGIAISILFFIGIFYGSRKKVIEPQVKQMMPTARMSAYPVVDMYQIGI